MQKSCKYPQLSFCYGERTKVSIKYHQTYTVSVLIECQFHKKEQTFYHSFYLSKTLRFWLPNDYFPVTSMNDKLLLYNVMNHT